MNKRIAIDLNDVIRDYSRRFITVYKRFVDPSCDAKVDDMTSLNYMEILEFEDESDYERFRYEDYAFELNAGANLITQMLDSKLSRWYTNELKCLDDENVPEVMIVSTMEGELCLQATLSFLSKNKIRFRELYFPVDSSTIWDRCDILVTANPKLIAEAPEGKTAVKIDMPYNKDVECGMTYESLEKLIDDKDFIKMLEEE